MTTQIRRLIELTDLLAFELRCRQCSTTMAFPLEKIPGDGKLRNCPNCHADWLASPSIAEKLTDALANLARLRAALEERKADPLGFGLHIEIRDTPSMFGVPAHWVGESVRVK
jgi:hypothetical protein